METQNKSYYYCLFASAFTTLFFSCSTLCTDPSLNEIDNQAVACDTMVVLPHIFQMEIDTVTNKRIFTTNCIPGVLFPI